ncbi:SDR family oxidoreductase [Steroidobacter sp. S1-65]|uniref:SDR family oxidoreductase n=1 Tax=Steroidobacter gossypii TaxID=2805490 RepID=A0ABS1X0M0_9GAMM|nr:SDR family oxidoreductase [Steroidobacter gossypii]MBM0106779.1 SDR family oxidoreductase [Steroidobacter gossypii]
MQIDLTGQNVLVTGASRGIGAAIARALAASGARVCIHYGIQKAASERLAAQIGNGAFAVGANLADRQSCISLWEQVEQRCGAVHALVNNAGVALESPLDQPTDQWHAAWESTLAINLTATGLLCRSAIAHFQKIGGGRIVNIASRAAFRGDTPDYLAYAASKGGMVALSRSIARGFGKANIKSFVLAPGFTRTEMAQAFIDKYGEGFALNDIALERLTEPSDIAPTVVFLLSGLADHATGTSIDLNAGSYVR